MCDLEFLDCLHPTQKTRRAPGARLRPDLAGASILSFRTVEEDVHDSADGDYYLRHRKMHVVDIIPKACVTGQASTVTIEEVEADPEANIACPANHMQLALPLMGGRHQHAAQPAPAGTAVAPARAPGDVPVSATASEQATAEAQTCVLLEGYYAAKGGKKAGQLLTQLLAVGSVEDVEQMPGHFQMMAKVTPRMGSLKYLCSCTASEAVDLYSTCIKMSEEQFLAEVKAKHPKFLKRFE